MNNFTSFDLQQRADICTNLCKMTSDAVGQKEHSSSMNMNYFYYIGVGGLLVISEALGLTKKVPQGSIIEFVYVALKKLLFQRISQQQVRKEETPAVTTPPPPASAEVKVMVEA